MSLTKFQDITAVLLTENCNDLLRATKIVSSLAFWTQFGYRRQDFESGLNRV